MKIMMKFLNDDHGQDLVEYTLLMAFIALASAALFAGVGTHVTGLWQTANNQLSNAVDAATASS